MSASPRLSLLPGLALSLAVAALAGLVEHGEVLLWGHAPLEALVLAILLGSGLRTALGLSVSFDRGIRFAAKPVMEVAIALLGAGVSAAALAEMRIKLMLAIAVTIALVILIGYRLGRGLGLSRNLALLVACGNAICGNSAIVAVAPAIGADGDDVAAAIGFTAIMGIVVVCAVAPLGMALHLTVVQGGMLAGMTVYAVPQVLAAASPLGATAVQVGAIVKLVRVLMLGPVVGLAALLGTSPAATSNTAMPRPRVRLVPGFIVAFAALAALRGLGLLGEPFAVGAQKVSVLLTLVAMAGLGLGVDLRRVGAAGPRVTASVVLSLLALVLGGLVIVRTFAA